MTRPKLILGALAAACVGMLLWCAWLILAADLPRGAQGASWVLWLVSAAAVATLLAYLREFLRHRAAVGRDASWKPLPGLVLLWVGGATALASFAFVLPERAGAAGAQAPDSASTSVNRAGDATSGSAAGRSPATTPVSRSSSARTTPPVASTTAPHRPGASPTAAPADPATSATKAKGSSGHPSTGKPTPSTTSTSAPLISITLPPPPR